MPDPEKAQNDFLDELESLTAAPSGGGEKLPVPVAPLPPKPDFSADDFKAELSGLTAKAPHVTTMPLQKIEGTVPKQEIPWYEKLGRGLGHGALLGFEQDYKSLFVPPHGPAVTAEGIPATYAGMDAHDSIRQGMNQISAQKSPLETIGSVVGSAPIAIGTGGESLAGQTAAGAALMGARMMADAGPNLPAEERAGAMAQTIAEHPVQTAAALAAPAIMRGIAQGAKATARSAMGASNKLMTQTFMTPAQRAVYEARKGPGALEQLGQEAREAGLFKKHSLVDWFKPATGTRVARNAAALQETAGQKIGQFEDALPAGGQVDISPITTELRAEAAKRAGLRLPSGPVDASVLNKYADALEQTAPVQVEGPAGLVAAQTANPNMSLPEAIAHKREIASQIDWAKNPNAPVRTAGEDAAQKFTWSGLKDVINRSLEQEAAAGRIDPAKLAEYAKANKDFSIAATVYDPALRMAEREGQAGLSLGDLMAGSLMGGGVPGAVLGATTRGVLPATIAGAARGIGHVAGGAGKAAGAAAPGMATAARPIEKAQAANPGASKSKIEAAANESLKDQVTDWVRTILNRK